MECRHKSAHWMMKRLIILIVLEISTFNIKFAHTYSFCVFLFYYIHQMTKKQLKFAHTYQINVCENKIKFKRIPHGDQSCGIFIKYSFLRNPSPRYTIYALPAMPETALRRCRRIDNSCASEPLRYAIHQTRSGYPN